MSLWLIIATEYIINIDIFIFSDALNEYDRAVSLFEGDPTLYWKRKSTTTTSSTTRTTTTKRTTPSFTVPTLPMYDDLTRTTPWDNIPYETIPPHTTRAPLTYVTEKWTPNRYIPNTDTTPFKTDKAGHGGEDGAGGATSTTEGESSILIIETMSTGSTESTSTSFDTESSSESEIFSTSTKSINTTEASSTTTTTETSTTTHSGSYYPRGVRTYWADGQPHTYPRSIFLNGTWHMLPPDWPFNTEVSDVPINDLIYFCHNLRV